MYKENNLAQILLFILFALIMLIIVVYFQHKSYVNSANQTFKPLTIEEKIRFKGGLDAY